jgi:hypothetical protein
MKEVFKGTDPRSDGQAYCAGMVFYTITPGDTGTESIPTQVGTISVSNVEGWKFQAVTASDTGRRLYRYSRDGRYIWRAETGEELHGRVRIERDNRITRLAAEEEHRRLTAQEIRHHELNMQAEMKRFLREIGNINDLYQLRMAACEES